MKIWEVIIFQNFMKINIRRKICISQKWWVLHLVIFRRFLMIKPTEVAVTMKVTNWWRHFQPIMGHCLVNNLCPVIPHPNCNDCHVGWFRVWKIFFNFWRNCFRSMNHIFYFDLFISIATSQKCTFLKYASEIEFLGFSDKDFTSVFLRQVLNF